MKRSDTQQPTESGWFRTETGAWRWYCVHTNRWSWSVQQWMLPGALEEFPKLIDTTIVPIEWEVAPVPDWVQALVPF